MYRIPWQGEHPANQRHERKKKKVHSAAACEETPHDHGSQKENHLSRPDPARNKFSLGFKPSISKKPKEKTVNY